MNNQFEQSFVGTKIKNYSFLKQIGSGCFGKVYNVYDEQKGNNYAAKVVPKDKLKKTPKLMQLLKSQIKVLKQCKNENVVAYIDNFTTDKHIILIMQLCDGGELQQYLDKKMRLTQQEATYFLKQIINGFKGLHQVKAMHRDFKASNVLIHKNICKIADLGFSIQTQQIEDMVHTVLGTSTYMAPQVLQQKAYGRKADIWSLGVVYYLMLYGKFPYYAFSDKQILKLINNNRPNYSQVNISEHAKNFIDRCLTVNPKQRINWSEIYDHPILHQQKMVYSVTSRIRLSNNRQIYQRQESTVKLQLQQQDFSQFQITPTTINIQNQLIQGQKKQIIQQSLVNYQKMYLNYRNKIMFIYKHVTPAISRLHKKISANHSIIIFLICKNCCIQMKQFNNYLQDQNNFLNINQNWQIFTLSQQYLSLKQKIAQDIQICQIQTTSYMYQMPTKSINQQIKSQLDIYKVSHQNWRQFYHKQLEQYQFQLISYIKQIKGQIFNILIKLILSIEYILKMKENDQLQNFQRKIENILDYQKIGQQIYGKLQKRLKQISQI